MTVIKKGRDYFRPFLLSKIFACSDKRTYNGEEDTSYNEPSKGVTLKKKIPTNVEVWDGGIVLEDGLFLACESCL